jgi:mannose-6-phosphate isomerase-like protein (cupin superfamily)
MNNANDYINSGILEMYVVGLISAQEKLEVETMAAQYPQVKAELEAISLLLAKQAPHTKEQPNSTVKPLIMATVEYMERLQNGEPQTFPPELNENAKIEDYTSWLNRSDLQLSKALTDIDIKLIGHDSKITSAIVWIKEATPYEIHEHELEKFLIIEGTCDIITDDKTYSLVAGDYFCVPLHLGHVVKVTSLVPCKVVLQRVAA